MANRKVLGAGLTVLAFGGIARLTYPASQYIDMPGFDDDSQPGRTRNSVAALVAGAVGQKLYGSSTIDLTVEKTRFPSAKVTGHTTKDSIDTLVDLTFTHAHFTATRNSAGYMTGEVDKSEFNWKVKEDASGKYEIIRFGPKFNAELDINCQNGKIEGKYVRHGVAFNWDIAGTYDDKGHVDIHVSIPAGMDIGLKGNITKTN